MAVDSAAFRRSPSSSLLLLLRLPLPCFLSFLATFLAAFLTAFQKFSIVSALVCFLLSE